MSSNNPEIISMQVKEHAFEKNALEIKATKGRKEMEIHRLEEELKKYKTELLDLEVKFHQAEEGSRQMKIAINSKEKALELENKLNKNNY